jgi:hypothetical protein
MNNVTESFGRVNKIKNTYPHFRCVRDLCKRIEQGTDPQHEDLEPFFNDGMIVINYNKNLSEDKLALLEERLSVLDQLRSTFQFNPDLNWLCVVSSNLTRAKSFHNELILPFVEDGGYQLEGIDPQSQEIIEDLQVIMMAYAQNEPLVLLCGWLDEMLQNLMFPKPGAIGVWRDSEHNQTSSQADRVKIQQALNYINDLRYENRDLYRFNKDCQDEFYIERVVNGELDWVCDMATHMIAILPSIGNKLDGFCDVSDSGFSPHSVWGKYFGILVNDADSLVEIPPSELIH